MEDFLEEIDWVHTMMMLCVEEGTLMEITDKNTYQRDKELEEIVMVSKQ